MKRIVCIVSAFVFAFTCPVLADFYEALKKGDYETAFKEAKTLAEQGDVGAQYNLGVMFDKGQGVPQNNNEAFKWFKKAAEKGDAGAQYNLGRMYVKGENVPQNYVQAYMWYCLSAAQGEQIALNKRDALALKMTPEQVAGAQKLASEWKPKK